MYVYFPAACSSSDASSAPSGCLPATCLSPLPGQLSPVAITLTTSTAGVWTLFNSLLSFYLTLSPVCPKPVSVECHPGRQNKAIPLFQFRRIWPVVHLLSSMFCCAVADALQSSHLLPAVRISVPARWWKLCPASSACHGGHNTRGKDSPIKGVLK